ncbi:hypothetical protein M2459_000878 [Parabacteroides sp. PF5-5]|nr:MULTISPECIES: hypothetical protein [unclassified Parabacteroides]MDH6322611.1 hypothetical protein [Parabacteroides sp. PH5-8]MDH6326340.1 hypothetical protein [Parabacteroides sp. PH5-41]MDH6334140.1 hypothetical protein [Parabacteroides sp. PF5-5]MDH6360161.1 hypothetical protein [Parabacteroides sp. PH5-16]MDH6383563.1 hypothetical protein [Parabacteroides sp. PH5-17]
MYNENLLGTSDVSILKFYYASFKVQQQKGKALDVNIFLDDCAKISEDSNLILKVSSVIPFFNLLFGTGREQKHIAEIIRTKREEVENLFIQDDISDEAIKSILYGISPLTQANDLTKEDTIQVIKDKILKCYSIRGRKQLGDRIFGYLLASELIPAYTPEDRLQAWQTLIGEKIVPSDTKLHANPSLNRSNVDTKTLLKHLDTIREFYSEIGLAKAVFIIEKDMKSLSVKV